MNVKFTMYKQETDWERSSLFDFECRFQTIWDSGQIVPTDPETEMR